MTISVITPKGICNANVHQNCETGSYLWNIQVVLLEEDLHDRRGSQTAHQTEIFPAIAAVDRI